MKRVKFLSVYVLTAVAVTFFLPAPVIGSATDERHDNVNIEILIGEIAEIDLSGDSISFNFDNAGSDYDSYAEIPLQIHANRPFHIRIMPDEAVLAGHNRHNPVARTDGEEDGERVTYTLKLLGEDFSVYAGTGMDGYICHSVLEEPFNQTMKLRVYSVSENILTEAGRVLESVTGEFPSPGIYIGTARLTLSLF